jgi:hypothetical protein
MATQGDFLNARKARNQAGSGASGTPLSRGDGSLCNDANFNPILSSSSAEYFRNPEDDEAYAPENRWKMGGGIETGGHVNLGGGQTRNEDGTIDRVKDPPKEILPLLYAIRMQCSAYNVILDAVMEEAGGSRNGTIPRTKFASALVGALHRMPLTEAHLSSLNDAYGCGAEAPAGSARSKVARFEAVAWKDFCVDVAKAQDLADAPFGYPGGPPPLDR